ncbi:hypothetical protein GCM10009819_12780 [Agromyces tropicus]|uniref:Uncharacterized protein n=1 Tax=Agromyces tropicus TaxID=555371 RepID=A0ABN2U6G2_9MICO
MTLHAHPTRTERPTASGLRRFSAYVLHTLGAVIGACAAIFTLAFVPAWIAGAASQTEYGQAVSLGWDAFWQVMVVVPAAAVGVLIAMLALLILRGYRRNPVAYVLIGVAGLGLVVSVAGFNIIQAERGLL